MDARTQTSLRSGLLSRESAFLQTMCTSGDLNQRYRVAPTIWTRYREDTRPCDAGEPRELAFTLHSYVNALIFRLFLLVRPVKAKWQIMCVTFFGIQETLQFTDRWCLCVPAHFQDKPRPFPFDNSVFVINVRYSSFA
jgi:hypothetical protein